MSVPIRNLWQNQNCPIMQKLLYFFNYLSAFEDGLLCDHRPRKISTIARALRLYSSIYLCSNVINTSMQDHRKEIQAINYKFPLQPHQKYYIHTVWRTWLFIALLRRKMVILPIITPHLSKYIQNVGGCTFSTWSLHSQEWSISNFRCTRNVTIQYEELGFSKTQMTVLKQSSLPHSYMSLEKVGRMYFLNLGVKRFTHTQLLRYIQVLIEVWMVITFWTWKTNFVCLSTARLLREICTAALLHRTIKPQNARLRLTETESEGPEQMWGE